MKPFFRNRASWFGLLLLTMATVFLGGCATSDPDNASVRPWNTPKSWETGLPSNVFEGR